MVEQADGGITQDTDVTIEDVSPEVMDKVTAGLAALTDDPSTKDEKGERQVLNAVSETVVDSAIDSEAVAGSTVSAAVESTVNSAVTVTDSVVSAAVTDGKNYDLEDNVYRAAVHQGWKPEEIQSFMEQDPDRARATLGKLCETNNNLSKNWAEMGRAKLAQDTAQQTETTTKKDDKPKSEFKEVDISKLKEQYDNDPIVDLVASQQEQNKVLFDMVNDLNETISTRPLEQQEQVVNPAAAAVGASIDAFFKRDDMKMYASFYGTGDNLTPGDVANRTAMFELADQITAGRALQGLDTTVDEALTQAHMLVTEPIRETMVRKGIVSQLKKRSNSLSLRPASAGGDVQSNSDGKPKTAEELVDATRGRLDKVFG
ncbi:hypothetical protein [Neptuniibacter sp.]|uniref:hypothetical protein n=1 Tax=Neptuniibacter sp. TaxID=1962643 RepID=UPI002609489A|nr:hypothetical protein [Neptuniibacter sp.]MCP4598515.1 hypothetical protein [Neptuniibacter sp.]